MTEEAKDEGNKQMRPQKEHEQSDKRVERFGRKAISRWPVRGWVGLVLIATCWPLNWTVRGITAYLFAPLWVGYVLVMDCLVAWRTGTSIWERSRKEFVLLFVASSPVWWIFEMINHRTRNWEYLGSAHFTTFEYYLLCTISFSTVMPAVFETAELVASFNWVKRAERGRCLKHSREWEVGFFVTGVMMLVLTLIWPRYFYPFVWTSLLLILEPLNRWLGREHLMEYLARGDWRPVISLSIGALICGFFWEMWNFYSWPKWIYHTPGAQFLPVFEMPLLGYLGYVPFGLELFALKNLISRLQAPNFKLR
jgi:hypothetical protein